MYKRSCMYVAEKKQRYENPAKIPRQRESKKARTKESKKDRSRLVLAAPLPDK